MFLGPTMIASKGNELSFIGWLIVAIILFPIVWSIIQISKFYPESKSFYNYSNGLGINGTFMVGWSYFIAYLSKVAIQLIGLTEILHSQFKFTFINQHLFIFYALVITFLCYFNTLSFKSISKILNWLTLIKFIPIFLVIVLIPFFWNPNLNFQYTSLSPITYSLPFALFGYWGFESCTNLSSVIRGERKGMIIAIIISFICTTLLYTFFHFGLLHIMGTSKLASAGVPAFVYFLNIKSTLFLHILNVFISSIIAIFYISTSYGIFVAGSTILYNLAQQSFLLFSPLISKTNKNERPINAIILKGLIIFTILIVIQDKMIIAPICNSGLIFTFSLILIALLILQIKNKEYSKTIITFLAFISMGILLFYNWSSLGNNSFIRLQNLLPVIIIFILGFIMFKLESKRIQRRIVLQQRTLPFALQTESVKTLLDK